jgi:hypothetical protein
VLVLGNALSIAMSLLLTLKILGLPPFSGVFSVIVLRSRSMSVQNRLLASPDLMAVSLSNCRRAAVFLPHRARASLRFQTRRAYGSLGRSECMSIRAPT